MRVRLLLFLIILYGSSLVLNSCSAGKEDALNTTAYTYTVAIKDIGFKDTIAIEVPNGTNSLKYYKCISIDKLAGAAQEVQVKANYFVAMAGGEIALEDLEKHSEINVVHQFADLKAASKAGIAIWIDKNAADQVDLQWLNQSPQLENPIVLVGYNDPLYSFREVLNAFGIEGPSVDWSKIQLTPGFSVWLWKEHTSITKVAFNKGYDQTATVEHITAVTAPLLEMNDLR